MHIRRNLIETLWRIIDGRSDKEKIVKICTNIQESNHALQNVIYSNSNGHQNNLPWLFIEKERNVVKEVIWKITSPTGFSSNIKNILTKKGEFGGVKTHGWRTFIKVIILVDFYIGKYMTFKYYNLVLFSKKLMIPLLLQYVLPLSLNVSFDNNVKQVIYDLGKYMR
jgi:hypothetical protein